MKKMKKVLALILAMAMVLGMGLTTFAEGTKPTANDKKPATVTNVEAGATVTAYQIVKADYDTNGFTGYSIVHDENQTGSINLADKHKPTSTEVTTIATNIQNRTLVLDQSRIETMDQGIPSDGYASYTKNLAPGWWVVLVTGTTTVEVYNPMLIGVYYSENGSDNTMTSNPIDANANWTLETVNAYAKSTKPTIEKTSGTREDVQNDVAIGDTVYFTITTAIPSYSNLYKNVTVRISDTLSEGLTLDPGSIEIKVGDATYTPGSALTTNTSGFTLTFPSDYAIQNGGEAVEITYSATLNENAGINFVPNTNTAKLEYSNNPQNTSDLESTEDKTYTYTFGIDADLYATNPSVNKETSEIIKVDEDGNVISTVIEISEEPGENIHEVLKGATFTLTNIATNKTYTATTDVNGKMAFEGLDAGTYTLVETEAPSGFTLDPTTHTVVINAEYKTTDPNKGLLESYTITIDGEYTSTYTATYNGENVIAIDDSNKETINIKNTTIPSLPSTGGIGTTIFTVGGCIIMIAAAALFFMNRRKSEE